MLLQFRGRRIACQRPLVMTIVNRTPDSFYDRGATFELAAAKAASTQAVAEGTDMLDLGGVTASPGQVVTVDEELARIVPLVEWAKTTYPDLLLSIDTWRHEIGDAACQAGADPKLAEVAAAYGAGYICAHAGGREPRAEPTRPDYHDMINTMRETVIGLAEHAEAASVPRHGILIDATGYGKNTTDHLHLLAHVHEFVATGWPVLMALSNKTFVGDTLDVDLADRLTSTLAATAIAARDGAAVFRAHQTRPTRQTLEMAASINGTRPPAHISDWIA